MSGHKSYPQEFQLEVVKLVTDQGVSSHKVARDLGVDPQTLRRWLRDLAPPSEQLPAAAPGAAAELARLRREVEQLRQERDILKKPSASSRGCHSDAEIPVCGCPRERVSGACHEPRNLALVQV